MAGAIFTIKYELRPLVGHEEAEVDVRDSVFSPTRVGARRSSNRSISSMMIPSPVSIAHLGSLAAKEVSITLKME